MNYEETSFTKKEIGLYLKAFFGKIKDHLEEKNPDRVKPFMKGAKKFGKFIIEKYDEMTLYQRYFLVNLLAIAHQASTPKTQSFSRTTKMTVNPQSSCT